MIESYRIKSLKKETEIEKLMSLFESRLNNDMWRYVVNLRAIHKLLSSVFKSLRYVANTWVNVS